MTARVWVAEPQDAAEVARLLVAFRDLHGPAWPSDNAFLAGVERLMDDPAAEFLLGAPSGGGQAAAVAQLRHRYGIRRAGFDCLLEDLFVEEQARVHLDEGG